MATDSNRFPLHRAIKKILDDPNSRPELPGLEPEPDSAFPQELIGFFPDGGWSDVPIFSPKSLQAIGTARSGEKAIVSGSPAVAVFQDRSGEKAIISGSPAVAVFQDKLYIVFEGGNNDGWLYYGFYDGEEGSEIKKLGNDSNRVSGSPALVVFQDKLYCVHAEVGETGWLYYCTFDGQKWSDSTKLPKHGTSLRERRYPCASLAVHKGVLCCVHEGYGSKDGKGWLWYCTFNGQTWSEDKKLPNHSTKGGGSLTEVGGYLYCLHRRNDESGAIWLTYTDDLSDKNNWTEDEEFVVNDKNGNDLKCKSSGPPGVTRYGIYSYWVHEGPGTDGVIWSFNNETFIDRPMLREEPAPQRALRTSGPPAVANYKNNFYIVRQGPGDSGQISASIIRHSRELDDGQILLMDANAPKDPATIILYNIRRKMLYSFVDRTGYKYRQSTLVGDEMTRSNVETILKDPKITYCTAGGHGLADSLYGRIDKDDVFEQVLGTRHYDPAEAQGKIFHFFSCLCGYPGFGLGQDLVNNGAKAFLGYSGKFQLLRHVQRDFCGCDIEIDIALIDGETAGTAYDRAIAKYDETIKKLRNESDYRAASILQGNRDLLVIYGDRNATIIR